MVDGISKKMSIQKMAQQRRFVVKVGEAKCEYVISDETNELVHYEGDRLDVYMFEQVSKIITQYFPNTKAIKKIGEDDYEDYDDY